MTTEADGLNPTRDGRALADRPDLIERARLVEAIRTTDGLRPA